MAHSNPKAGKGQKLDHESSVPETEHFNLDNLSQFEFERVHKRNSRERSITLLGSFKDTQGKALITLEKKPFDEENVRGLLKNCSLRKHQADNSEYQKYLCNTVEVDEILIKVIHPADEKRIKPQEVKTYYLIEETPQIYKSVTLPHLEKSSKPKWITNILKHEAEAERIVFQDDNPDIGFILLPNRKWSDDEVENLSLLAIARKEDIRSIRDLRRVHLDLLKNILNKGTKAIEDKYKVPKSQLNIYLHYMPTYCHLHVHFTKSIHGMYSNKCHHLQTVISNLELMDDYYERATLMFSIDKNDPMFKYLQENKFVKPYVK